MRIVDSELGPADWTRLIDGEAQPWGGVGEHLRWRPKTHTVALLDDDDALLGTGGVVLATVRAGQSAFEVVGIGGIFVTRRARGQGLASSIIERLLQIAGGLGPDLAMLFCLPSRMPLYARFGFAEIAPPVRAMQPDGPITVPMRAMWRALAPGARWPDGEVELLGEPL